MHMHDHDNDHFFSHLETPVIHEKDQALIEYLVKHNKQHVQELAEIGKKLADAGLEQVSAQILDAAGLYNQGNDLLEKAALIITAANTEKDQ